MWAKVEYLVLKFEDGFLWEDGINELVFLFGLNKIYITSYAIFFYEINVK